MHFWVERVNKKSQEAFPILKAMARMLYELDSLQNLILVFHILLTQSHSFQSSQRLQDERQVTYSVNAHHLTAARTALTIITYFPWALREGSSLEGRRWVTQARQREGLMQLFWPLRPPLLYHYFPAFPCQEAPQQTSVTFCLTYHNHFPSRLVPVLSGPTMPTPSLLGAQQKTTGISLG